jgi:uncharacterized membrane protein YeaQ/YmgE (transglycosylase-associated protein family)
VAIFQILGFLLVGLVIGVLARMFRSGRQRLSLAATLGVGCAGALVGGIVATLVGTGSLDEIDFLGFVVAVIASVGLLGVLERGGTPR